MQTSDEAETEYRSGDSSDDHAESDDSIAESSENVSDSKQENSKSASQPETTVIADFGNLEELTAETNTLLADQNELLTTAVNSFTVIAVLLGMIAGLLAVVIFGGAMNHDHN